MELTSEDIFNNDFDWFVIINDIPIHVASDGTPLPNYIARNFDEQIDARKEIVKLPILLDISDLQINPDLPGLTGIYHNSEEYEVIMEAFREAKPMIEENQVFGNDGDPNVLALMPQELFNFDQGFEDIENDRILTLQKYLMEVYIPEFSKFGERGFASFDHTIIEAERDWFHWVVKPNLPASPEIQALQLPSLTLPPAEILHYMQEERVDLIGLVNDFLP